MKQDERAENIYKSRTNREWKKILTPVQYEICRQGGTEKPFTGEYHNSKKEGIYFCICCKQELFNSQKKFDSGTGWPSFADVIKRENIETRVDYKFFMKRTEVLCSRCGAHLGHVFEDGPPPTNLRYCINSVCLNFIPKN